MAAYREQEVEVAFGPMGVLEHCDVGTLTRRIDADHVVRVVPSARSILKSTVPKPPRVVELLRKAIEWKALIESGKIVTGRNDGSDKNVHISKSRKGVISVPDSMIRISRHQ
jgi:hypothetical protein